MLDAILTMIGYYVAYLAAAMILIVVVVQIFRVVSARREAKESAEPTAPSSGKEGQNASDEFAAAMAAISMVVTAERSPGVSAWSRVEREVYSPWKLASRSRRISPVGG